MTNRFNLIDEAWIPIADVGRVSLRQIFSDTSSDTKLRALGGNPVQKIALMKLLLAIAQAASTPKDLEEWRHLGWHGLAERCLAYLDRWHERFFLYGEQPFLQMPDIVAARIQSYGAVLPEVSTGNTTVLTQGQSERPLGSEDKALLLIVLMGFALGGKKTDNSVVLAPGYRGKSNDKGKASTGKPGPAVAHMGLLHCFCLGESLAQSLWLNLLTLEDIAGSGLYSGGLGTPVWEAMPVSEDCQAARSLKLTLQGRLVPLSRFCLLTDGGMHYSEGLAHSSYLEGVVDPSVAVNFSGAKAKVLWVNPDKRPWRELTALLSFLQSQQGSFECLQLRISVSRSPSAVGRLGVWAAGLKVSSNAGEQYVSGSDDAVESVIWLDTSDLNSDWFSQLKTEVEALEGTAKSLFGCVSGFYKQLLTDGTDHAKQSSNQFWQLCERDFQKLVINCETGAQYQGERQKLRRRFADYAYQIYNRYCPQDTARQLDAWAKCRPNLAKYLKQEV